MTLAIRAENIGKMYRVAHGAPRAHYRMLRDHLTAAIKAPFRRLSGSEPPVTTYENFWALKDISFDITTGDVVGIIGRNGAGKSTLLKVLSRITRPSTGKVEITGRVGSLLEVGTGFHPELTGRENVFLNGSLLGMGRREIERKFDEIVAFAEVEQFLDTPVKRYSSGMYVRLAFAVAAHLEPEVLIVDEVLAVGDAAFQKKCLNKMQDLATSGRTILFVSHSPNTLRKLCDIGILLDGGRVIAQGPVDAIVRQYSQLSAAAGTTARNAILNNSVGSHHGLIVDFCVLDADRRDCFAFAPNATVRFAVIVNAAELEPTTRIGVGVNNPTGERTFGVVHTLTKPAGSNALEVVVECKLPNLVPGRYELDIAAMDENWHVLHSVTSVAAIEVIDSEGRLGSLVVQRGYGHVMVPATWTVGEVTLTFDTATPYDTPP